MLPSASLVTVQAASWSFALTGVASLPVPGSDSLRHISDPCGPRKSRRNVVDGPFTTIGTRLLSSWLSRACRGWVRAACPQAHTGCRSRVARVARTRTGHSGRLSGGSRGRRRPARDGRHRKGLTGNTCTTRPLCTLGGPAKQAEPDSKVVTGCAKSARRPRGAVLARGALSRKTGHTRHSGRGRTAASRVLSHAESPRIRQSQVLDQFEIEHDLFRRWEGFRSAVAKPEEDQSGP
jgi:hypothetical protein